MMSSVSPLHPIGKLVNPGPSGTFYGLGPSSVTTTTTTSTTGETVSSPLTVNCIGVDLPPSSPTTSSSSSFLSLPSTIATTLTTTTVSTNSVVNLINCSTPLPSIQSSPSSTTDSGNVNIGNNNTNNYALNKSNGKDLLKANVPYSWRREKINGTIVYISPSNCFLWSHQDVSVYLLTDGTCKCGLECPIILEELFNFDPRSPSISLTPVNKQTNNCNHLDNDKSLNCKSSEENTSNENHFQNKNPINDEYPPKTCNHRRRNLIETSDYSSNHHHHNHHINSNDNFSTTSALTTTNTTTTTTVNDTRNQTDVRLTHQTSPTTEDQPVQHFTNNPNQHSPTFHHQQQPQQPQQLTANSIPFYRSTYQQSIINPGVTIFKSDTNFNLTKDKEPPPPQSSPPLTLSSSYTSDPHHPTNIPKDFHSNPSPLTTNSYINWLPLNASDDNRLTAIVNENQSFANTSTSSLPGFADVISGMSLTSTLINPHNPVGSQLVQLYNPVQYTSVPPNAVALLSPAQNLNRDGSATILIPSLMQSADHLHHHHHQQQQQPIVLNSTENVSSNLDHQTRNLLPTLRSTSFSSIPLQTPYTFQPQLADSYSAASSSSSPTQSYTVTPTSIINNSGSNDNSSDNSNLTRIKTKSKAKSKLIKRRSPRNRKAKENNQRLNQPLMCSGYINQKQEEPDKLIDQVIDEKETVDESSSRLRLINDYLINDFDDEDEDEEEEGEEEEPMDSHDCDYEENQSISQSEDDKGDFEYERIDDSAQCTSEDIMRELSSQQNSTIRNVGVQSDELIGEPEMDKLINKSTDCSDQMVYSSNSNNNHEMIKNVTEEEEEDEEEEDEDEEVEIAEDEEEENDDDGDYSFHSDLPDDSEGSSEKDDKINDIKTTCTFILQDDEVNDSFNELDDNESNFHQNDENNGDNDEDEFEIDDNTKDNDLLSSSDDLSVNFVHHGDNNNNISINSDNNSLEGEDEPEDDYGEDNYDNQNTLISMATTMTSTNIATAISSTTKQSNLTSAPDIVINKNNYLDEDDNTNISTFINQSSKNEKPADEGLFGRLSNNMKATTMSTMSTTTTTMTTMTTTTTITPTIEEDSTKNRNNKRLERLRKELLCYENSFDQTTAQSPPLSPQVRSFETGDLVWGQNRGNPSWPGKLVNKDDVPGTNNNGQADREKVWVKWFGDNLVTQVELDKLKTLSEGLEAHHTARKKHRKGKKTDSCLDQAIQEAMNELDKQMDKQIDQQPLSSKSHLQTTSSPSPSPSPSSPTPSPSPSSS